MFTDFVLCRWAISWKWADSGVVTESVSAATRVTVPVAKKAVTHHHKAAYFRKIAAALHRKAARMAALRAAARRRTGRKLFMAL